MVLIGLQEKIVKKNNKKWEEVLKWGKKIVFGGETGTPVTKHPEF